MSSQTSSQTSTTTTTQYEYFRAGTRAVWHIAPAFSHLPLPERNQGKSLCGYSVAKRHDSTLTRPETICEKCAALSGAGTTQSTYTLFTASNPTIEQLKERRAECVRMALVTYRMAHTRHPKDIQSRDYWTAQCRYWTDQAYHAHGEIMAQLERPEFPVYYDAQGREHAEF